MDYLEQIKIRNIIKVLGVTLLGIILGISPITALVFLLLMVLIFVYWQHELSLRLFLFILPFHTLLTSYLIPTYFNIDNTYTSPWRELLVLLLLFKLLVNKRSKKISLNLLAISIILFVAVITVSALAGKLSVASLYGFRVYSFPFLIFCTLYFSPVKSIDKLKKTIIISSFIACIYGFLQIFVFDTRFLLDIGYGKNGYLDHSFYIAGAEFQRLVGPFGSPNEFGSFLVLIILFTFDFYRKNIKLFYLVIIIFELIALIYTFSRSAWISLIIASIYYLYKSRLISAKFIFSTMYFGVMMLLLVPIFSNKLFERIATHLFNTVTLNEPSSRGHLDSLIDGFYNMLLNPMGFGLGLSGPRSKSLGTNIINVENSFILIAYELGIIGLLLFIAIIYFLIQFIKKDIYSKNVNMSLVIALIVNFMFLPNIQSLDVVYIFWILIALNLKVTIKDKEKYY